MQFCNTCYFTKHLSNLFKITIFCIIKTGLCKQGAFTSACFAGTLRVPRSISLPAVTISAVSGDGKRSGWGRMFSSSEARETMTRACFKGDKRVQRRTQKVHSHRETERSVNKGIFLFKIFFYKFGILLLTFSFSFWLRCSACGIFTRWQGTESVSPCSGITVSTREVPRGTFFKA